MRRFIAVMSVLAIMFAMSPNVKAASMAYSAFPGLSFNGTTYTCSLTVYGGHSTDSIEATVTLKRGSTVVSQWTNLTANGYMNFSDTANVEHGKTYTMQVSLKINGVSYSVADITKTCP